MLQDEMIVVVEVPEVEVLVDDPPDITVIPEIAPDVIVLATGGIGPQGPPGEDGEDMEVAGIQDSEFPVWDSATSSWIRSTADLVKIAAPGMLIDTILLHKVAADALQVDARKFRVVGPQGDVFEVNNAGLWAYFGLEAAVEAGQVSGAGMSLNSQTPQSQWDIYTQSNKDGIIFWNIGGDRFRFGTDGMWLGASNLLDVNLYRAAAGILRSNAHLQLDKSLQLDISDLGYRLFFGSAGDVSLYRSAAGILRTDGIFNVGSALVVAGEIYDSDGKWFIDGDGAHQWGPGTWVRDTNLYRQAAGHLKTDGIFEAAGGLTNSSFPRRLQTGAGEPGFLDADLLLDNGWHYLAGSSANAPTADQYHVNVIAYGPGHLVQVAYAMVSDKIFIRRKYGTWASWTQIYPSSGGGVDYIGDWAAPTPYKKGDVVRHNGNDYVAVNDSTGVTPPAPAVIPTGGASIGTSLPTSPFDGQEAILVDSLTAPTYAWRFKYVASISDAYKWVFIGGASLAAKVLTTENTNSTTYVALTTPVQVAVPRAGLYNVRHGFVVYIGASYLYGFATVKLGAAAASDNYQALVRMGVDAVENSVATMVPSVILAANDVLAQVYKVQTPGTGQFRNRWLEATPVRVS
jgi:hypothetical protein